MGAGESAPGRRLRGTIAAADSAAWRATADDSSTGSIDLGGSVEVFPDAAGATERSDYVSSFGGMLADAS